MTRVWLAGLACLLAGTGIAAPCPEPPPRPDGTRIEGTRSRLAGSHATTVIARGTLPLAGCADVPGDGHVPRHPQVNLMLADAGGHLVLRTVSACDTVLLVRDAEGGWHFDDDGAGGLDALVVRPSAERGRYDVWVGNYGPGSCAAQLILSVE
jgi:hypothetical protein